MWLETVNEHKHTNPASMNIFGMANTFVLVSAVRDNAFREGDPNDLILTWRAIMEER